MPSCNGALPNSGLDVENGECSALPDPGPCTSANKTKWYYDQTAKSCKSFQYTGCGGNSNNYATKELCEDRCADRKTCDDQQAPLQDENFNIVDCSSKSCPQSYTCKRGRALSICCPTFSVATASSLMAQNAAGTCAMPKDRGTCDKFELKFFYNKDIGECKYFFYSGCGGNSNNFKELAECQRLCGKRELPETWFRHSLYTSQHSLWNFLEASTTQQTHESTSLNIPPPSSFTSLFAQRRTTVGQLEP
uniref:BPTI/Kunitz inhibitor domain-containing protein n=1 Tax=Romanomermis culicivorax TaxID=13658 RepID=A0A915K1T9_ROMCU